MQSYRQNLAISIDSNQITCCVFTKKNEQQYLLNSYSRYILNCEIEQLVIYNFKNLVQFFNTFLTKNNLKNPYIFLSLSGKQIIEKIVENNDYDQDKFANASYKLSESQSYQALVPHYLIFQYNLLFKYLNLKICTISTGNLCKLKLLQNYSPHLLSSMLNLSDINNKFNQFIELNNINNLILFNKEIDLNQEQSFIFNNLGLFLLDN